MLLAIGGMSATGASSGTLLGAAGPCRRHRRGAAALGEKLVDLLAQILRAAGRAALALMAGLRRGASAFIVWREQRARRSRVAAAREEHAVESAPEPVVPAETSAAEPARPLLRRGKAGDPTIVDHEAERSAEPTGKQEAFRFAEATASGPFKLPDISIFQRPPVASRTYDRDSLIMNSRILEKKLADFGVGGRVVTVHPGPSSRCTSSTASGVREPHVTLSDDLALALRARCDHPRCRASPSSASVANAERDRLSDLLRGGILPLAHVG
jgi:S-DNA-T family DNA segregation ATPase FtsK/SpoIIIE